MAASVPSHASCRLARAAHFSLLMLAAHRLCITWSFTDRAFTGHPYDSKRDDAVDLVPRNFFKTRQGSIPASPKPANTRSFSVDGAAKSTADRIMRLTLRATEVFEKAGSDAHSADLDIESTQDWRYMFRALVQFQGLSSAHLLFDPTRSVRLSRSARDAHFADKDIAKLRVDVNGKGNEFWTNILENATQQLHPAGKGAAVQLLLDGAMGSRRKNAFHKTVFILIMNIHREIAKLNSGAKLYFLPQKFGTEDAGSMSVLLWLA
eukprot:TRINITY_DN7115_c0_g1_i3.p1 TRINITY_DN7115_c0_g1~~TRINITY_DN7115_c0_g1_i3.p1  ORF type:complete len:264 (-),score=44.43 TRINITY_DN7115_c0_g1_i3:152-943(-)